MSDGRRRGPRPLVQQTDPIVSGPGPQRRGGKSGGSWRVGALTPMEEK